MWFLYDGAAAHFARQVLGSSHRNLKQSLDSWGRSSGFATQVTGPHTVVILFMGPHENLDLLIAS